ncbi:MAG: CDP-alcohol phosphatidyltransferase family protein [Chloroflexi bacterium]|nr:CDP-alcohol phosphatidyltransferase family protein [Chloroflexota bacterium]MQC25596.1 CDP-alcohol phosphatidyltransferase family protein [Chloroflexota bacterium]MQC47857.1 CDP-alcohol phosphatidyltransferase family protein [Chloroflexota bacterium]
MTRALLPRRAPAAVLDPIVRLLARAGVTPFALTTVGFLGNVMAAVFVAQGAFLIGGVLVLVFSALDMLDGALARSTGRASRFGALYDSTLDRVSEAVVLFGLAWWAIEGGHNTEAALAFAAVVGSLMVSYVRARAEGLGLELKDGLFTRSERVALTGVALILGFVTAALWALAVLTMITAAQRTWIASRMLIEQDAPKGGR